MEEILEAIARKHLGIPTLKPRGRDCLDFHEMSVWRLKDALQNAYDLGKLVGSESRETSHG